MSARTLALGCLLLAAPSYTLAQPPEDAPLRLNLVAVRDPQVNNAVAFTVLVPEGWVMEGGIEWRHRQSNLAVAHVRIGTPDGRVQIESFPIVPCTWQEGGIQGFAPGSKYLGNLVCPPITDAAAYVGEAILPLYRNDVGEIELVESEPLPGVVEAVSRVVAEPGLRKQVIAERLRARYAHGGQAYEEDFYVALVYAFGQVMDKRSVLWQAQYQYAFSAPAGELDAMTPLLNTIVTSIRVQPEWFAAHQYVVHLWVANQRQSIADAGELSRRTAQNADEIRRMSQQAYEDRQRSQDTIHREFGEAIRGVETYDDPVNGGTVQLPGDYRDVWISQTGEYLLSNDVNYNPNEHDTITWQRAVPAQAP